MNKHTICLEPLLQICYDLEERLTDNTPPSDSLEVEILLGLLGRYYVKTRILKHSVYGGCDLWKAIVQKLDAVYARRSVSDSCTTTSGLPSRDWKYKAKHGTFRKTGETYHYRRHALLTRHLKSVKS